LNTAAEVQWYKASQKDDIPPQDARSTKARLLRKALPKMASEVKVELADWGGSLMYDGVSTFNIAV
jgi:hypothetical protein